MVILSHVCDIYDGILSKTPDHKVDIIVTVSSRMINKVDSRVETIWVFVQVERELVVGGQVVETGAIGQIRSPRVSGLITLVAFGSNYPFGVALKKKNKLKLC